MTTTPGDPAADARRAEYQRQVQVAADALVAAIRTEATDGGETVTHLLATVAANLGGVDEITAGRPGSWEADGVQQLLRSTVGYDGEHLLAYRTAPIEVVESIDEALAVGDVAYLYDDVWMWIDAYEDRVAQRDSVIHRTGKRYDVVINDEEAYTEVGERLDAAADLLDQLRETDAVAYRQAFERHVQEAVVLDVVENDGLPAEIPVRVRWVTDSRDTTGLLERWGTVEYQLWEHARNATPLPGFTDPFSWSAGTALDQLRAAGRLPHQRIPELSRYHHLTDDPRHQESS